MTNTQFTASDIYKRGLDIPVINHSPLPKYSYDQLDYGMTISIERTPGGRLWACWVGGGDSDAGYFVLASSDDNGETWSDPRMVIDPHSADIPCTRRTLVGALWTDPMGRLWLFFDQSLSYFDGRAGDWYIRCDNPDDDQPAWTEPVRIWHGCTLNKPIILANGEWMLPISLWDSKKIDSRFIEFSADLNEYRMANLFVSNDQGNSWTRRGGVEFPQPEFDEHMVIQRRDGSLWMLARTSDGIWESTSDDNGATWTAPQRSAINHISARFHLRRLISGRILLIKHGIKINERTESRTHLTAYLSDDDGYTWSDGLLLDERGQISYPDSTQAPDGTIYISYDKNRATEGDILLARITEEDILAGKIVTPGSVLKNLISRPRAIGDFTTIAYDGFSPDSMVCDTTLRELPDGSWALFILAGGDFEPSPENYTAITRSYDQGRTWSALEPVDVGFPREGKTIGQGPTDLLVVGDRCTLFYSTHSKTWGHDWKTWMMHSYDNCRTWTKPEPMPGRLANATFIRPHIKTRDGRIILPFQHYLGPGPGVPPPPTEEKPWWGEICHYVSDPRMGVLISADGGNSWTEHGNIKLTDDDRYHGWAEPSIVELADGKIAMVIRADRLGGVLYYAESPDGGITWPDIAVKTDIPNPGSKASLFSLGGDTVAMLHNPNPAHRSPLALWISYDGIKSWPYRRVLVNESCDGPDGRLNYPDGFVSSDGKYLNFAYDDNRHRAVFYQVKIEQ
jgi:predicted neuraminidase